MKQSFEWVRDIEDETPDLLCVVLDMGIAGAAVAAVFSQTVSWVLASTVLYITYLRGNWLSKRIEACGLEPEVR